MDDSSRRAGLASGETSQCDARPMSSTNVDRDRRKVISAQFTRGLWTINDALSDVCALVIRLDTMLRQ